MSPIEDFDFMASHLLSLGLNGQSAAFQQWKPLPRSQPIEIGYPYIPLVKPDFEFDDIKAPWGVVIHHVCEIRAQPLRLDVLKACLERSTFKHRTGYEQFELHTVDLTKRPDLKNQVVFFHNLLESRSVANDIRNQQTKAMLVRDLHTLAQNRLAEIRRQRDPDAEAVARWGESLIAEMEQVAAELTTGPAQPAVAESTATITLKLEDVTESEAYPTELTADYLSSTVVPFIQAIVRIQKAIDDVKERPPRDYPIKSIQSGSIDVTLSNVAEVVEILMDIGPWRLKHAEKMALLDEREREAAINKVEAETCEINARTARAPDEAELAKIELGLKRVELEQKSLEVRKIQQELYFNRVELAIAIAKKMNPDMPDNQALGFAMMILEPLETLTSSNLEVRSYFRSDSDEAKK